VLAGGGGGAALAHLSSLRGAFTGLAYGEEEEEGFDTPIVSRLGFKGRPDRAGAALLPAKRAGQ
jgi:hypothetical protein